MNALTGGGYPRHLRGAEIPLGARIFSVVDSLDAMIGGPSVSSRPKLRRSAT